MSNSRRSPRYYTVQLLEAMDGGLLDAKVVAEMALNWLSEADVASMVASNDLEDVLGLVDDEDEEESDS